MDHPSQVFQIWNTKQERNKSLKIKNLVADNNEHQNSTQIPVAFKSIRVNPFQLEIESSEVNKSENFRASKYIDENNKFLICNTDRKYIILFWLALEQNQLSTKLKS